MFFTDYVQGLQGLSARHVLLHAVVAVLTGEHYHTHS